MKKTNLELYLQKVAQGDLSFIDRLCARIGDRLIFVPIVNSSRGAGEEKIQVYKKQDEARSIVPLFTSQARLKDWNEKEGSSFESISLLGADICLALGESSWIVIDPGFENSVELQPQLVRRISGNQGDDSSDSKGGSSGSQGGSGGSAQASNSAQVSPDLMRLYDQSTPKPTQSKESAPKFEDFTEVPARRGLGNFFGLINPQKKSEEPVAMKFCGTLRLPPSVALRK